MRSSRKLGAAAVGAALASLAVLAATGAAGPSIGLTPVANANAKTTGMSRPNVLSPELQDVAWAQGSTPVENPSNNVVAYGYLGNGTFLPVPSSFASPTPGPASVTIGQATPLEAQKTEPDKNTYLVLDNQKGADPNYDYGRHFLFQGHEAGSPGYITRINLDADGPHRVTLMATKTATAQGPDTGANLPTIDGSTWDPWANRLLFTAESPAPGGGVWQGTLDVPSSVDDLRPYLGSGGFEGIQNDDKGNLYIAEDTGGSSTAGVRRPNSFIYRFLPKDPANLKQGGTIQALQVLWTDGQPITFADGDTAAAPTGLGPNPPKYVDLHKYGTTWKTKWIDLVTTTSASTLPGPDVNALAKAAKGTPFKRPENGVFQPGSKFKMFYFTETGDTSATAAGGPSGGWGSLLALKQDPKSNDGSITTFYNGDLEHASFDNIQFFGENQLGVGEDRGDTLHGQQPNGLDSAWMFDTSVDYSKPGSKPVRFIAEGRDASATIDSALLALGLPSSMFSNDGDNETTGLHVSDGDPKKGGILGSKRPKPFSRDGKWRSFWTQQHGDNTTFELVPSNVDRSAGYDEGD